MNRNKLNIRMDLLRVAKTALDLKNPFDQKIAHTFLDKVEDEFAENLPEESLLIKDIAEYKRQMGNITEDPLKRIRWGEKVLTIASRLGIE